MEREEIERNRKGEKGERNREIGEEEQEGKGERGRIQ